ncbi:hypothetical protein [Rhizobium leguminosarum]|uniref:hypothetical protein n=1 Tax=Rhizobium leguminosarum TaxID=384 RepID=UPI001F2170BE|nr:hypothetical protein [Rhizobium leguminosarum]UIJ81747.1 hypothetical protein LZK78_10895 [Rhizobium leguminosarum]
MRHEHFIKQHMLNIRDGIKVSFQVPTETTYHRPTIAPSYTPVLPSRGNRKPSEKSPFNWRGNQPSLDGNHTMHFESGVELKAGRIFRADRKYVEVREQWPTMPWRDDDGKKHTHTFDYFLVDDLGICTLVAAKPKEIVLEKNLVDTMRRIRRAGVSHVADKISIVTEAFATMAANANAEWMLLAIRNRNDGEYAAAREFVAGLTGAMRFWDMLVASPEIVIAHRRLAIWHLIYDGVLAPIVPGRITDRSYLIKTGN